MEKRLSEVVDFLEDKIHKLMNSYTNLQQELTKTKIALNKEQSQKEIINLELEALQKKYLMLKNANALLGSDEHKKETKHKINALIREIDTCIEQLS